jgi:hypothetical protein
MGGVVHQIYEFLFWNQDTTTLPKPFGDSLYQFLGRVPQSNVLVEFSLLG